MDMEQQWQQPCRPMRVKYAAEDGIWVDVLFIRVATRASGNKGWEVMNRYGTVWDSASADLMFI